jgi:hypothetical protein
LERFLHPFVCLCKNVVCDDVKLLFVLWTVARGLIQRRVKTERMHYLQGKWINILLFAKNPCPWGQAQA